MRGPALLVLLALGASLAATAPAAAHVVDPDQTSLVHLAPHYGALNASEWQALDLDIHDTPLEAGDLVVLNILADKDGAGVNVTIGNDAYAIGAWYVPGDGRVYRLSAAVPEAGEYRLNVTHAGAGDRLARYWLFFDATCDCPAKPLPIEVPRGLLAFREHVPADDELYITVPEPAALSLNVTLARRIGDGAQWPGDFAVVANSPAPAHTATGDVRLHKLHLDTAGGGPLYLWVEAAGVDRSRLGTPTARVVAPLFELASDGESERATPGAGVVGVVVAGLAAIAIGTRGRR